MTEPLLGPADRTVFSSQVLGKLRDAILDGRFSVGRPLRERQIARDLDLSRAPVREALRTLENEGLVFTVPHRGTFVASYTARDIEEIYTLRASLEGLAFSRATSRATAADLRSLEALIARMDRLSRGTGRFHELIRTDLAFHRRICEIADHERLLQTWEHLSRQILAIYTVTDVPQLVKRLYGYVEDIGERHRPILRSLRDRDIDAGRSYISTHILEVAHIISEQTLERSSAPGADSARRGREKAVETA